VLLTALTWPRVSPDGVSVVVCSYDIDYCNHSLQAKAKAEITDGKQRFLEVIMLHLNSQKM
jgi:hypothetical protein